LPHKLGIVLPSKDRDGKPLGKNLMKRIRARALRWFKDFGGSTEERRDLRGTYVAAKGQVIQERVTYVWTFCTTAQFRQSRRELVDLAEAICRDPVNRLWAYLWMKEWNLSRGENVRLTNKHLKISDTLFSQKSMNPRLCENG